MSIKHCFEQTAKKVTGNENIKCRTAKEALSCIAKKACGDDTKEFKSVCDAMNCINEHFDNLSGGGSGGSGGIPCSEVSISKDCNIEDEKTIINLDKVLFLVYSSAMKQTTMLPCTKGDDLLEDFSNAKEFSLQSGSGSINDVLSVGEELNIYCADQSSIFKLCAKIKFVE